MAKQRVQVQDLPDAPKLQATVQSGGQYGVAVQQVGRNSLLDLADSLKLTNKAGQAYGALGEVQGQIGAEQALTVSDADLLEEIRKTEPDTFLTIQRNKAFRNTLLKRAVNNNLLPAMQSASDDLLDLETYKTQGEFLEAVDEFMGKSWKTFSAEVGQDAATSDGGKVLWNAVTGPFKADMLKAYDKKMDDFIVDAQGEELGLQLDAMTRKRIDLSTGRSVGLDTAGLQELAQNREKLLKEAGVHDPKQRSQIIVNGFARQVDTLITKGRYTDAERMLGAMNVIQVNKKPIFRTTDARKSLNQLRRSLTSAVSAANTESDASKRREYSGRVGSILDRTKTGVVGDLTKKEMADVYGMMGASDAKVTQLIEEVAASETPNRTFYNSLARLAQSEDITEEGEKLYYDTIQGIKRDLQYSELAPLPPSQLSPAQKTKYVQAFQTWRKQKGEGTADEWMRDAGLTDKFRLKGFKELEQVSERLSRGDYVLERDEYKAVNGTLGKLFKNIADNPPTLGDGEFGMEADESIINGIMPSFLLNSTQFVQDRLKAKALEVADQSEAEITEALKTELIEATRDEERMFKERVEVLGASLKASGDRRPATDVDTETQADEMDSFGWWTGEKYDTLDGIDKTVPFADVKKDRDAMIEAKDRRSLSRSLFHYGFPSWDVENLDLLEQGKPMMDADDVKLFRNPQELQSKAAEWGAIMRKEENRESLTPTEKRVKEEYRRLGIHSADTLETFYYAQSTFF